MTLRLLLPCKNIVGSAALAKVCGLQVLKLLTMVITLVMSLIKKFLWSFSSTRS